MKELQEFINKLYAEKAKAHLEWLRFDTKGDRENGSFYDGKYEAFDFATTEAELLLHALRLNSEPEPQLNKANVSRSVYEIEYSSIGEAYAVKIEGKDMWEAIERFRKYYHSVDAVYRITAVE